jgi:hypothetical protein
MCNALSIVVCPFVLFLLAIVLSVFLRYTTSDYCYGIFKVVLCINFKNRTQCSLRQCYYSRIGTSFWDEMLLQSYRNIVLG